MHLLFSSIATYGVLPNEFTQYEYSTPYFNTYLQKLNKDGNVRVALLSNGGHGYGKGVGAGGFGELKSFGY